MLCCAVGSCLLCVTDLLRRVSVNVVEQHRTSEQLSYENLESAPTGPASRLEWTS